MRVMLSTVGTRGDVQPVLALAVAIRESGHQVKLCIPPNFLSWAAELGFDAVPVGIEMRAPPPKTGPSAPLTEEQLQKMRQAMPDLITDQFDKIGPAAKGCDVILGGNAHQYAARSIADMQGIPYVNALYAPVSIPTPDLAPPPALGKAWEPGIPAENSQRWQENLNAWNVRALERVNVNRSRLGLPLIDDVLSHVITNHPWLATDATLGPAPSTPGMKVFQTGAWILKDTGPLAPELESFLQAGAPPIYFGFGSMPVQEGTSEALIHAARAVGRRMIVSRGWSSMAKIDDVADCLFIGDVNQQALFPRVAAVVHHGGAGTTTTAACAGTPQIVSPMFSDQFYWAHRVQKLGVGAALAHVQLTVDSLAQALHAALTPEVSMRARSVSQQVTLDGAQVAARELISKHA